MPRRPIGSEDSSNLPLNPELLAAFPAYDPLEAYVQESENDHLSVEGLEDSRADEYSDNSAEDAKINWNHQDRTRRTLNLDVNRSHTNQFKSAAQPVSSKSSRKLSTHLIFNHVHCTNRGSHKRHGKLSTYLDRPRLFKGDSKLSVLRGQKAISDVSEYLEQHGNSIFVVDRIFKCHDYHEQIETWFDPLPKPKDPEIPESIKPFFFSLRSNGHPAKPFSESLKILSKQLKDSIVAITGMSLSKIDKLENRNNMEILSQLLYHFDHKKERDSSLLDPGRRKLLDILIDYMKRSNQQDYEEADELFSQGLVTKKHLAKLCGPNELMVTSIEGQPRAFQVHRVVFENWPSLHLDLWCWGFDGTFYKEHSTMESLWPASAPADSAIPITNLGLYPLSFAPAELEKRLTKRGEVFWKSRKMRFVAYDPPHAGLELHSPIPRYIVDSKTHKQMHGTSDSFEQNDDLGSEVFERDEPPGHSFTLLLPDKVLGFGIADKNWRYLLVERVREIEWNDSAFDRLVMKDHKKELIKALVTVHTTSTKSTDIIEGKGNALIILLHGGPGTGKTLTAESVAELTRKALYRVTCGDIGTNAEEVEKYLKAVLLLGTTWGCVVLLDEADVFLEERRETDLQRNALVSVFLRVLEYYDGILILTSNRVGTFDGAFKSRFQLAVHYPALDAKGRFEIWLNFINGLAKTETKVDIDGLKEKIEDLANIELNGRQIRNAVRTASQLAQFKRDTLCYQHFERVLNVVSEFEKHIESKREFHDIDWERQGIELDSKGLV